MEEILFKVILILTALISGFDQFFGLVFNQGLIYVPINSKQITMKFVLSALVTISLPFRIFILSFVFFTISFYLLNTIELTLLTWLSLFIQIFYQVYFTGYLFPKIRRIIHWDYKNPVSKWEDLYTDYVKSSNLLIIISLLTLVLTVTAFYLHYN